MAERQLIGVRYRGESFFRARTRKETRCWHCTVPIRPGESAFRPFGNGANRMQRLCEGSALQIAEVWPEGALYDKKPA